MAKYLDENGAAYLVSKILGLLSLKVDTEEGKSLSEEDFTTLLKEKLEGLNNYSLPSASENVLGGIKIGPGLEIDAETGIVSTVNEEEIISISQAELDAILYNGNYNVCANSSSIQAMINNNEPKVTILIEDDIQNAPTFTIPEGKSVILDLRNNTISGSDYLINVDGGEVLIKNGTLTTSSRPVVVTSGTAIIDKGANIVSTNDVAVSAVGENSSIIMNNGKITAQESGLLITTGASLILNGGEVECNDNCPIQGNGTVNPGNDQGHTNIVMNGGKLIAHIQSNGYTACGIYVPNSGKFVMNGGEVISDGAGLVMRAGEVELNGGSIVANGATGVKGKVGDSSVTVGPYAVVYDEKAKYPGANNGLFQLTIGEDMVLTGTDGDINSLLSEGAVANIIDNR